MAIAIRWLKRRYEHSLLAPRRKELARELTEAWGRDIQLIPASTSESYDEIHYALHKNERIAVVRVNSPFRKSPSLAIAQHAGFPLGPKERLELEWNSYSKLAPQQMSPEPLWRTDDAIACSWLPWDRASVVLVRHRDAFWNVVERVLPAIRKMHDCGITHLDMNLGNLLLDPNLEQVAIIDFEFGPASWITHEQQKGFDYLRLVTDCTKRRRGGKFLAADPDRMVRLLDNLVDEETRHADLRFAVNQLHRLDSNTGLQEKLLKIFPRLR